MKSLYIIIFYIFGTVFASFYNCLSYRLINKVSIMKPRSYCDNCKKTLKWYDMIPIVSYIISGGQCRYCGKKIPVFYPVSELLCGVLFAVSFYSFGFSYDLVVALLISSLFIIVMYTDLNYYIIPDEINLVFAILIFITNIFRFGFLGSLKHLGFGAIMFLFMYALMFLGNFVFKEESLGGGDIKLLFGLGMIFPVITSFVGVTIAAILALPLSVYLLIRHKDKVVPFGPFLVAGFLMLFLLKINISDIYNIINNLFKF